MDYKPPAVTPIDEDLNQIEKDIRELKVEYDMFFSGGRKRPPVETQWRLDALVKRYGDRVAELNSAQRFRFANLTSTYAKYQDLWRKKMAARETGGGQRHYGAAARIIAAERARARSDAERNARQGSQREAPPPEREPEIEIDTPNLPADAGAAAAAYRQQRREINMKLTDPVREVGKVRELYAALVETRISNGETSSNPSLADFERFVRQKTQELQKKGGREVEYSVGIENGKVKLKARVK
jgi:hypothetical protein